MSEAKFTKGEWRVRDSIHEGGFEVSFNKDGELVTDYIYEEADAHLIAAAPELYSALESIVMEWRLDPSDIDWIEMLLAKARGEV